MSGVTSQFLYHLVANNMIPMMAASVSSMYMTYFSGRNVQTPTLVRSEVDDERELDLLQMDRMLKWMSLVFEDSFVPIETPTEIDDTHKAYKKELYSIYMTIGSDYKQYRNWKNYNSGVWILSSYRNKDTKMLARKILADVKLFHEGLKMFSMFEKL
uniref:Uncharacterized protein n=1 Tax=viral metagenome TaxID=1070528 RepID=A0A6C0KSZ3_9ZZZZ